MYEWYLLLLLFLTRFHRIQRRRQLPPAARSSDLLPDIIEKAKKLRAMVKYLMYAYYITLDPSCNKYYHKNY